MLTTGVDVFIRLKEQIVAKFLLFMLGWWVSVALSVVRHSSSVLWTVNVWDSVRQSHCKLPCRTTVDIKTSESGFSLGSARYHGYQRMRFFPVFPLETGNTHVKLESEICGGRVWTTGGCWKNLDHASSTFKILEFGKKLMENYTATWNILQLK